MSLNFNVDPYYDDFDQTKNFHRILFKPGVAVQARELTQAQTILQDQITKFADNIFKQNSPVTGGQVTTNFDCHYIKLRTSYNNTAIDVTDFEGKLIQDATGEVIAKVLKTVPATGTEDAGDPPTLVVSYKSGSHFQDDDVVYDVNSNLAAQAVGQNATGSSSVASIAQGVFYVLGNFVQIQPSTVVLNKYSSTPNGRVGLEITETIVDYINDSSLLDPAVGASNYQAPGADRYEISLDLSTRTLDLGDDQNFIELIRVTDGSVAKMVDGSVYNVIDDYFAKRDYETNGDYVVEDFKLTPKPNENENKFDLNVGKGLAYVHGYRIENQAQITLTGNRARTTATQNNNPVFVDIGSYFYVDDVRGNNSTFLQTNKVQSIDLHCVSTANVDFTTTDKYNSTVIGSAYIRGLVYDHANGSDANTYVYKAYVNDLQMFSPSGSVQAATTNTVQLPSTFSTSNEAYVGATIVVYNNSLGTKEFRTISGYNGSTKTVTVSQNWTVVPTTSYLFNINYNVKDAESIAAPVDRTATPVVNNGSMRLEYESRSNGTASGDVILENPTVPEMIFKVGSPFVSSISGVGYTTQQVWRNVSFTSTGGSVVAQLAYTSDYLDVIRHFGVPGSSALSSDLVKQNYTIIVTDKKSNTLINNGDILNWTTSDRTVGLNGDASIATFTSDDLGPFTATIIAKVFVENGDNTGHILKYKNLIEGNTTTFKTGTTGIIGDVDGYTYVDDAALTSYGQVYITYDNLKGPGVKQSLFLSDVKNIKKIIDTKTDVSPTSVMFTNPSYDVTNNYIFDNGQRDSFYDHASITLKPGAPVPKGNILVILDYYQHTGGDGYFCLSSYTNSTLKEDYREIPRYTSTNGTTYELRDSMDFRPARLNAQKTMTFRYSGSSADNYGLNLPVDLSIITNDYSFYLGRKDKLVLSKDRSFEIIEGSPSISPLAPSEPDGSLVIANLTHKPYTGYIPTEVPTGRLADLSIDKVKHKRYTMQDIAGIENRINQIEYYSSLSLLEQNAQSLQISDSYGLNRFKNGILVDDFSSYATADTMNLDYFAAINRRDRKLLPAQTVKNFPLKSTAVVNTTGVLDNNTSNALGYSIKRDGMINYFSLPYTTANAISQKFASRTVNVNPFSVSVRQGTAFLTPNMDNWVDTKYSPSLLITDPNMQIWQSNGGKLNTMSVGDWKTIPGTTYNGTTTYTEGHNINPSPFGYVGYSTTQVLSDQKQQNLVGRYDKLDNTYSLNNGYVQDISILPYTRAQQIVVRARGMLFNTLVTPYFDGVDITSYFRKSNVLELSGVTGTFTEGDTIGALVSGTFYPTGRVVGVHVHSGTNNVRLYVAADPTTTAYTTNGVIQNAFMDSAGVYRSTTANGTLVSQTHFGGRVVTANTSSKVQLSTLASSTDDYYTGNTIHFCAGTGAGQSATITKYFGSNTTAVLSSSVTFSAGDIYSIGTNKTDESGSLYGIFNLPENTFHTGQRVLRIDNSINGNKGTETTYCEGTFYSESIQTTSQKLNFGASPAGAKDVFTQTNYANNRLIGTIVSPWDPVAQTFIVSKDNYPNGMFLDSAKFFFSSKPTSDNSTITLSIVGTQNGYPNGETLDHSIVTLTPNQVKVSSEPQFLDPNTYTEFKFNAPIYIQPGVLYAFILKTSSSDYNIWTASNGDTALASSTKNRPTDAIPSTITKIGSAPYVGALFVSQNSQTWTADQNQSLMFVVDRCVFNTSATPTVEFVAPKKLPQRMLIDESVEYFKNANNVTDVTGVLTSTDVEAHAFNMTTTDFLPTTTGISYSYDSTLVGGTHTGPKAVVPGKFGTPTQEDVYLSDGKGVRILQANTSTSFSLYATLSTKDDAVSPIVSDAGVSTYAIQWNINDCEMSNNMLTVTNSGESYNAETTVVTISAPTGKNGTQAYATANIVSGNIASVYITQPGSGYIETPTITITDDTGSGAAVISSGETNKNGGNALAKYITKKVVLDAGFDSGDLNVYLSAYRPVGTDIHVYYKVLNRNDTQSFDDGAWQLMTKTKACDSSYSQTRSQVIEYTFAPGTAGVEQGFVSYTSTTGKSYNTFSQFALKVVMTTSDKTIIPTISDLRAIALPPNV